MNFVDTLRGLWRRWYIVLPGALIAASLAFGAWSVIPPGYERSSTQLLIPGAASMPEDANPYLFLGGLAPAADVLVRAVGAENVINEVTAGRSGVQVEITRDTATAGPVIVIVVTAPTDAAAEEILGLLVERTETVLADLQQTEKIAKRNRVTVLPITVDSQSILQQRNRFIISGAIGLAGIALTLVVAGLIDGYRQRNRGEEVDIATEDIAEPSPTPAAPDSETPKSRWPKRTAPATVFDQTDDADDDATEAAASSPVHSAR